MTKSETGGAASLRVGVIGAGYFARFHHEAWARMEGVTFAALCDRSRTALDGAAAQHRIGAVFADSSEFFAAGPYDIVDIATPPDTHLALIEQALSAARVVICQKPFCGDMQGAMRAAALSRDRAVPVVVHENFRFQPWYEKIRSLIADGQLGDLYQATFRLRPGDGQGPDAYLDRQPYFQAMQRFLIHETGIHWVDVFRWLFGEPEAVFADLRRLNPAIAGEDCGMVLMAFEGGFRAVFDGNRLADHEAENRRLTMGEFLVEGSRASVRLDGNGSIRIRRHGENTETAIPCEFDAARFGGDCVYRLQRHVVEHLVTGTPLVNPADDYLKTLRIEADIYRAQQERKWIAVSR